MEFWYLIMKHFRYIKIYCIKNNNYWSTTSVDVTISFYCLSVDNKEDILIRELADSPLYPDRDYIYMKKPNGLIMYCKVNIDREDFFGQDVDTIYKVMTINSNSAIFDVVEAEQP